MKVFVREPSLGLVTLGMLALMSVFIVLPQVQVVLVPGLEGYVAFFREGPNWIRAMSLIGGSSIHPESVVACDTSIGAPQLVHEVVEASPVVRHHGQV